MSRPGISLQPAGLDRAASLVAARSLAIDDVTGQITSVSLAGLEPKTVARTVAAMERATTLTRRASGITSRQGPALRRRAALARAADAGGGSSRISGWDAAKWIGKFTGKAGINTLDEYSKLLVKERTIRSNADIRKAYNGKGVVGRWNRARFSSWKDMKGQYRADRKTRLELLRKLDSWNYKQRAIESAKAKGGKLWDKTGKKLIDKLPWGKKGGDGGLGKKLLGWGGKAAGKALGPVTALATGIVKGESFSTVAKRVGAAGAALAVEVAIGAVGGAICAGAAVSTMGAGAVACPVIIGATAAAASLATGAIINHQIDQAEKKKAPPPPKPPKREWKPGRAAPEPAL